MDSCSSRFPSVSALENTLRSADCVCLDVDSTVQPEEGIDVLAEYFGVGDEVSRLTVQAMCGDLRMQDALSARLGIIKPTKAGMEQLIANHEFKLSSGVKELVQTLKDRQVDVYLVSGGFRRMILPVARILEIDEKNVFANRLLFCDEDGSFQGIDHNEPTSRAGGKAEVANILRRKFNYKCMVFIGDGATDLEAKQNVELFIGYGGVQIRPKVKELSDWFIEDFADMINVLKS